MSWYFHRHITHKCLFLREENLHSLQHILRETLHIHSQAQLCKLKNIHHCFLCLHHHKTPLHFLDHLHMKISTFDLRAYIHPYIEYIFLFRVKNCKRDIQYTQHLDIRKLKSQTFLSKKEWGSFKFLLNKTPYFDFQSQYYLK